MVHEHPPAAVRHVRAQDAGGHLAVCVWGNELSDVVQESYNNSFLVCSIPVRPRGGLQRVLVEVHLVAQVAATEGADEVKDAVRLLQGLFFRKQLTADDQLLLGCRAEVLVVNELPARARILLLRGSHDCTSEMEGDAVQATGRRGWAEHSWSWACCKDLLLFVAEPQPYLDLCIDLISRERSRLAVFYRVAFSPGLSCNALGAELQYRSF